MYTQCPECSRIYKITAEKLKTANGYVRCGVCRSAFNAIPHLTEKITTKVPPPKSSNLNIDSSEYYVKEILAQLQELQTQYNSVTYWAPTNKPKRYWLSAAKAAALSSFFFYNKTALDNRIAIEDKQEPEPVPNLVEEEKKEVKQNLFLTKKKDTTLIPLTVTTSLPISEDNVQKESSEDVLSPVIVLDTRPTDELMDEGKKNLLNRSQNYEVAINNFRSVILKEKVDKAREANELLGYAYEKSRMLDKAIKQYTRYLALYPEDGQDRQRVRQRLMSLEILVPKESLADISKNKKPREGDANNFSGTISEYSFVGGKEVDSITGIQFSASHQHNQYTLSSNIRLTEIKDFSNSSGNRTNLYSAYVDFSDTFSEYNVRAGRQVSVAGAISKFDGISANYKINDDIKVTAAVGRPYTGPASKTTRNFVGTELNWRLNQDWLLSAYATRDVADGVTERNAIGGGFQYTQQKKSAMFRVEYDTLYHTLNQITYQDMVYIGNYSFFSVFERRRSPIPYGDVGLGLSGLSPEKQIYNSVGELISKSGLTTAELYTFIKGTTPIATSVVTGFTKNINRDVSATADIQMTNLSTTPGFNINPKFDPVPIQIGQMKNYSLNLHLRSDNYILKDNTTELVLNGSTGSMKSYSLTLADMYRLNHINRDSVSVMMRYDSYNPGYGTTQTISTILRGIHTLGERGSLEAQYSKSFTIGNDLTKSSGDNFYIGYRYDF
jgi:predicted Zn finger-like uncharacterized protein